MTTEKTIKALAEEAGDLQSRFDAACDSEREAEAVIQARWRGPDMAQNITAARAEFLAADALDLIRPRNFGYSDRRGRCVNLLRRPTVEL